MLRFLAGVGVTLVVEAVALYVWVALMSRSA